VSWCWFKPASAVPTIGSYSPHVSPHNELPTSSLQLRFSPVGASCASRMGLRDGPAVPPSRHAGRCCGIPGSRTNHRELHRSPEIGLSTPVSGVRWSRTPAVPACRTLLRHPRIPDESPGTPPESRDRTSDLQPQTSITSKSFIMHCYEKRACKCFGMHCYKIIGLKVALLTSSTRKEF